MHAYGLTISASLSYLGVVRCLHYRTVMGALIPNLVNFVKQNFNTKNHQYFPEYIKLLTISRYVFGSRIV